MRVFPLATNKPGLTGRQRPSQADLDRLSFYVFQRIMQLLIRSRNVSLKLSIYNDGANFNDIRSFTRSYLLT